MFPRFTAFTGLILTGLILIGLILTGFHPLPIEVK